jgi:hypothetical protein
LEGISGITEVGVGVADEVADGDGEGEEEGINSKVAVML